MTDENGKSYVVDCNVIVKWFLPEEYSTEALAVLEQATKDTHCLYAPIIIVNEFAGVLSKYNKLGLLKSEECKKYFNEFTQIINRNILNLTSSNSSHKEVLELALKEKILYNDAEYLFLSKKLNLKLITYDKYLKRLAN